MSTPQAPMLDSPMLDSPSSQSSTRPPVIAFEGAIHTAFTPTPTRLFSFTVTFHLTHPRLLALSSQKPPLHFHPHQEEFITVVEGRLAVEVEGEERILTPADGEFLIRPWTNHRLYPPPVREGEAKTVFLLSGGGTDEEFRLDEEFFLNWYGYQDSVFVGGEPLSVVQVMAMFDAGGSYLSLPTWIPFSRRIAQGMGVVMGRWIGALLGYQPYYRKWSGDWELACERMRGSLFQRRFADREKEA